MEPDSATEAGWILTLQQSLPVQRSACEKLEQQRARLEQQLSSSRARYDKAFQQLKDRRLLIAQAIQRPVRVVTGEPYSGDAGTCRLASRCRS